MRRKKLPTLLPLRGADSHDGRERICVPVIHQMNYFDDEVCRWGIFAQIPGKRGLSAADGGKFCY
jgi:hypothetical protein